ncbi:MAG: PP2C family protein-serine/threonine phosphatase [Phycisphaerae bacterium]|nr:serine/threonine-protein phosphatase [Phycisphaerales bacterium]
MHLLLVDPAQRLAPDVQTKLCGRGHFVEVSPDYASALARAKDQSFDALLLSAPDSSSDALRGTFGDLVRHVDMSATTTIIMGGSEGFVNHCDGHCIDYADVDMSLDELQGRLATIELYQRRVHSMENDLANMHRLFKQLNVQFAQVDQEMRLAGRLQSAFLPQHVENVGLAHFAAMYRPATFVSGDIYDIYRVDEDHVAFYVADAVGHGMAASLLTMFIKNAVTSKNVHDQGYTIYSPGQTLGMLNSKLVEQHLPNSQFVTAGFLLLNIKTLELQFARAGHPYPFHCSVDGCLTELKSGGGLLGIFDEQDFETQSVTLRPGEKIILYSDGVELGFAESKERADEYCHYRNVLNEIAHLSADALVHSFAESLDAESGSLNPRDDVTLVVLEIADESAGTPKKRAVVFGDTIAQA